MTFKNVAIKNFTSHIRRYLTYFLCSSFTIVVFFIYSVMMFNDSYMDYAASKGFKEMSYISVVTVLIFSVFFINYAHSSFVRSRSSEFALFMTLGLTKKNISRMILIENIIILGGSLVTGILTGALFSRLFFLIISGFVPEASMEFKLSALSFVTTIIAFFLIYSVAIFMSRRAVLKLSIVSLIKKKRESTHEKGHVLTAIIGIILFFGILVPVLVVARLDNFNGMGCLYVGYSIIALPSMYIVISQAWHLYYRYVKKNKGRYYKKIISYNEMEYSFSSNRKIMFVLSLLSAMIIFFVASPVSLFGLAEELSRGSKVADVEYIELGSVNTISDEALQGILNRSKTPLTDERLQEFLVLTYNNGQKEVNMPAISETTLRHYVKDAKPIERGKLLQLLSSVLFDNDFKDKDTVTLYASGISKEFDLVGTESATVSNINAYPSYSTLVLNDLDYNQIKEGLNSSLIGKAHMFNFKNWRKTGTVIEELKNNLKNPSPLYPVDTMLNGYEETRRVYSMMIFITSFMGLLFLISAGSILLFKQYGELGHFRELYRKLSKIGLTKKEFLKMHAASLRTVFFTPLIFGTILGFAYMYMTTFMLGGGYVVGIFFRNSALVVVLYFVSQMIFYKVSLGRFKRNAFDITYRID